MRTLEEQIQRDLRKKVINDVHDAIERVMALSQDERDILMAGASAAVLMLASHLYREASPNTALPDKPVLRIVILAALVAARHGVGGDIRDGIDDIEALVQAGRIAVPRRRGRTR